MGLSQGLRIKPRHCFDECLGRFARPIGAKPFEPARPERLSKAETRDDGIQNPYAASRTVRSAPGRSEREAGAIVDLAREGKGN